jgi:hypothetical protein
MSFQAESCTAPGLTNFRPRPAPGLKSLAKQFAFPQAHCWLSPKNLTLSVKLFFY